MNMAMKKLKLILGDQLNYQHSWYQSVEADTTFLLMEMRQETDYTQHHIQKIIGFFAAMFNFARFLEKKGHRVIHLKINDKENTQNLVKNLQFFIQNLGIEHFEYQLPDEFRLDKQLSDFCEDLKITYKAVDSEHFFTKRTDLATFFHGKKTFLMENFYRDMRRKEQILMDGATPVGEQWNFDADNRKPYKGEVPIPKPLVFHHDYSSIFEEIKKADVKFFGNPSEKDFGYPTTRKQSLQVLDFFLHHLFEHFGTYEDAMHTQYWSLFHSRLSFALNLKMLSPREVVVAAEATWKNNQTKISLAQCEGFIRQILGWREYMRGIYWAKMPNYASLNFFNHKNELPEWFWTGKTKMNCLHHAVAQSLEYAYAHHIQRLMVTGNFMLLAGIDPDAVDAWYLGIYIDAIEWVEITNTRGMSQFADGGIVGSKPYVSSANYIDKMSDYCKKCYYDKKEKTTHNACPFNSLYWDFYERNRSKLEKNPRIGMMYRVLDKMQAEEKVKIFEKADFYLKNLNTL
jgi:deoxyribodipyrimidine photolyase-related protein